jgi:hypothetical protein
LSTASIVAFFASPAATGWIGNVMRAGWLSTTPDPPWHFYRKCDLGAFGEGSENSPMEGEQVNRRLILANSWIK